MNRRFLLQGLGYLSLASVLSGCGSASDQTIFVEILRRSFPTQLLKKARKSLSPKTSVRVSSRENVAQLYGRLQRWQQSDPQGLRLLGLGDYWLTQAIQSDLIEPLDLPPALFDKLSPRWQSLVTRDDQGQLDPTAKIWGAPYRWGATVLVYRQDKFDQMGWALKDWEDLWNPDLEKRVGLLDQSREVIGMTLKTLGASYNDPAPAQQTELLAKLRALHQQARVYSSRNYIEPLILGDVWVAMGWSSDVIPALVQDPNLAVIFPASGSSIWADMWVKAKCVGPDNQACPVKSSQEFPIAELLHQWVQYWWEPEGADSITKFTTAASVIPNADLEKKDHKILTQKNFMSSEFLLPLSPDAIAQYRSLWLEMRSV